MRKRNIIVFIGVLGSIILISKLVSFFIYNIPIFDKPKLEELATICTQQNKVCYKCFYISSNATTQDYIQLRRSTGGKDSIIASYERYDIVDTIQLINESTIRLVLEDTTAYIKSKDTIVVKIK